MTNQQRKQLFTIRAALDEFIVKIADEPTKINTYQLAVRTWQPATYIVGDVRVYEDIPYKCVQAHDSASNPDWTPSTTPSLWMQYHGTSIDSARPWLAPTGAHDMYKKGEYMKWTDDSIYECLQDTTYDPSTYAQAWKKH